MRKSKEEVGLGVKDLRLSNLALMDSGGLGWLIGKKIIEEKYVIQLIG